MAVKKRIFITGGEGFIGTYLARNLLNKGHEVATFDAYLNFTNKGKYYHQAMKIRKKYIPNNGLKRYKGDIRDYNLLCRKVKSFKPDILIHLAGLPMARVPENFADQLVPINMQGTLNVIDCFAKSNTAQKLVYTSSSMAYGHFKQVPQSEQMLLNPENVYGATKAAGEYFVRLLRDKDWVIIRPTSVYGFTDIANRVTQLLIDAAYLNKSGAWVGKGEKLDFSYIEDVAKGFELATLKSKANGHTLNISKGVGRSISDFAEYLQKVYPNFKFDKKAPATDEPYRGPLDISLAKNILNFNPKYNIEEGIDETLELIQRYDFYNF